MNEKDLFRRDAGLFFRDILTRPGWKIWAIAILFPVTSQWAATSTHALLARALENQIKWYLWALTLPFPITLWWSWLQAVKLSRSRRILDRKVIDQECRAMIIFLSPVDADATLVKEIVANKRTGDLRDPATRSLFVKSWRMPVEAIAHHLRVQDRVFLERIMF